MSQISLWLFPLAISAVVAMVIFVRNGLGWTWGLCLQQAIILVTVCIGLASQPGPGATPEQRATALLWTTFWAVTGWTLFVIFNVVQRSLLTSLSNDLSFLRPDHALRKARFVPILTWGPPGKYWVDMAHVIHKFSANDRQGAEEIIARWSALKLPQGVRESLIGFSMLGYIIVRDWEGVIRTIESQTEAKFKGALSYQMASRAYAELGRFEESVRCLERANLPAAKMSLVSLDTLFLTVFAIGGAVEHLKIVLERATRGQGAIPIYAGLYWLGRCYSVRADYAAALKTFQECREKTPAGLKEWHARIDNQIERLQERSQATSVDAPAAAPMATAQQIDRAEQLLQRCRIVSEIVRPSKSGPAVTALASAILIVYGITSSCAVMDAVAAKSYVADLCALATTQGVLEGVYVWQGQWWRLFTYQFLHAGISHLAFNLLALFWFGKLVENMYGTRNFIFIYLGSGVLSGLAQIIFNPHQIAVGASGAIMGVFGAGAAGMVRLKNILPASIRKMELSWMFGLAIAQILMDQVINYFANSRSGPYGLPHIASYAHAGGMIAGYLLGVIVPMKVMTAINRADLAGNS